MGLSERLGRFAAAAPVPVFAIAAAGARDAIADLRLRRELRLLDSPRSAGLLLVAGAVPDGFLVPLARIHDSMAHPRATVLWSMDGEPVPALPDLPNPVIVHGPDPMGPLIAVYRDLLEGRRPSDASLLPDTDPAPWRGVGPYGQGGSGMTGGVPYGRPMADLGPDPDGLRLDVLPVAVGPLFPYFPAGLTLDVRWAGDVILDAVATDVLGEAPDLLVRPGLRPFLRALDEPVSIADLELARARDHLRWLSGALRAQGLPTIALRALRLARTVGPGDGPSVARLARLVRATQVTGWSTRRVGRLGAERLDGLGLGPVGRASGLADDVRLEDPAYQALDFRPIVGTGGDAAARWLLRLAEAEQSLDLARRGADRRTGIVGRVESPRGRLEPGSGPTERALALVPALLHEVEWGDAVTTVVSLDLDLEEAALAGRVTSAEAVA